MAEQINEPKKDGNVNEAVPGAAAGKQNEEARLMGSDAIPKYLQELPVKVDILLGSVKLSVKELLSCGPGSVIDIGKKANEPFDLFVNGRLVAKGEVVTMHDRLGLKIVEVVAAPSLPS